MKVVFVTMLIVLALAQAGWALVYINDFACTRQTWMGRGLYSSNSNYSTRAFGRVCKGESDFALMDFDRNTMLNWVQSVYTAGGAGTLNNASQLGNGAVTMTMYLTAYDSWEDTSTQPPTVFGHYFWPGVRLSKGQDWVESTATFNYADASTSAPWHDAAGNPLANIFVNQYDMLSNMVLNATSQQWGAAAPIGGGRNVYVYDTPRPWVLDTSVAYAALKNPDVVGFECVLDMYNKPWGDPNNNYADDNTGTIYGRLHGLTAYRPYIEIDVDSSKIAGAGPSHTYLPCDFNHDLKVSFADYLILESNFGKSHRTNATGDANNDGWDNFADYLILESSFGDVSTPEPACLAVLVAGAMIFVRKRKHS